MTPHPPYGPLSLLAASILPIVGSTAIHSARHGLLAVGVLVLVLPWAVRDWRTTSHRLAFGVVAMASLGISTYLYGGRDLDTALGAGLRILYLFLPAAVLTAYIDPARLGDHLAQRLRLPARTVVAATSTLQRLESVGHQWAQIHRARRARGVGPEGGLRQRVKVYVSMALTLLVSTMRTAGQMSLAMDARGFAAAQRRTWAEPAPWQTRDSLILLAGLTAAALPWLLLLPQAEGVLNVR